MSGELPMTRRTLAALLSTGVVGVVTPVAAQPKPAVEISEAEAALRRNTEAIKTVDVPWDTEPAFRFQP